MNMRLLCIFAAILALSLAEESHNEHLEDLVAQETVELMKEGHDLQEAASAYNAYVPPSQKAWNPPQNYVPQYAWTQAPQQDPIQPVNYIPPSPSLPPQNDYVPTQHPPGHWPPHNTWKPPHHYPATTPTTVIKNGQYFGDNGSYRYEYQLSDGTHVGEKGWRVGNKPDDIVKEGWYSFRDQNGKVYTVKWWADHTGYHAYGDHLPSSPPSPKAIHIAHDETPKVEDEKPQPYPINLNPTQQVHTDYNYPPYQQTPVDYQPHPTYPTYQ